MTEEELLACAGPPLGQAVEGREGFLTYESAETPPVCRATVLLRDHRVIDVRYEVLSESGSAHQACAGVLKACRRRDP
jgi:hypothetical protein